MKKTLTITSILLIILGNAYSESNCILFFKKAIDYYQKQQIDSSIIAFKKAYQNCHDSTGLKGKAIYNFASLYADKYPDSAKIYYRFILQSDLNDRDPSGKEGIMADPYANYKYHSCLSLYQLFLNDKKYDSCLHYLYLADTAYPYLDWSGTDVRIKKSLLKTKIAYTVGLKGDIDSSYNMLWEFMDDEKSSYYSQLYFMNILIDKYGIDKFTQEFNKNIEKITYPILVLFDYKISIRSLILAEDFKNDVLKQKVIENLRKKIKIEEKPIIVGGTKSFFKTIKRIILVSLYLHKVPLQVHFKLWTYFCTT